MMAANRPTGSRPAEPTAPRSHPDELALAAYLDDSGSANRETVEAHLADCERCREALLDARMLLDRQPGSGIGEAPPPRRVRRGGRMLAWVSLAAAAVLVATVMPPRAWRGAVAGVQRSAPPTGSTAAIRVVSPDEGAVLAAAGGRLTWRATHAVQYRVVLLTSAGEELFTTETADTTALLPDGVRLRAGESYFWVVDAIVDGTLVTSGHHRVVAR